MQHTNMYMLQLTEDSTSNSAHFALKDALCFRCPVVKKWDETAPKLLGMKPTICVLLLGLLGMASCHGISTLTAQSGGPGTTADWPKGRRQGTLIERIIISANEIPTDRPSGGVVMFSGDSVQLDRMQRAQARRRGWTTSLSEGLRASTARHGTVAAVANGRTLDPTESRRDLDGSLFDQVCA